MKEGVGGQPSQQIGKEIVNSCREYSTVVNLHEENEKRYIEIIVPKYQVPISYRGKYYIRAGSTIQELKGVALHEFILKRSGKTWDDVIEEKASFDDIDEDSIKQFLKDASKANRIKVESEISIPELLAKLRLLDGEQVKRAAIILFAKDPGRFLQICLLKSAALVTHQLI